MPHFKNEAEERLFWKHADSAEYIEWKKAGLNPSFPNLKPSTKSISIRLPESVIIDLKKLANKKDVPYQSLMKVYLAEKIKEEYASHK
jgi:predicted DNA binding CopG/RHH family protein